MADTIKWTGYLTVGVNRKQHPKHPHLWRATASLTVGKPAVSGDEVAVKIGVELPVSLFTRPQIEARITVPESAVTPLVVEMEVLDNIRDLIEQRTGFDVTVLQADGKAGA